MGEVKCSIVIINYHTEDYILHCLETIYQFHPNSNFEIIIVNNGGTLEQLASRDNNIRIIQSQDNLGFSKANNLGARHANNEFILFLNADTYFIQSTIDDCIIEMERDNSIGVLGCKLQYSDGRAQLSYHDGHLFLKKSLWRNPFVIKFFNGSKKALKSLEQIKKDHHSSHYAPWISGAFFLMRKSDILDFQLFWDEDFFMYWEDVELCARIKEVKKMCFYYADKTVVHIGGSGESEFNSKRYQIIENAKLKCISKNRNEFITKMYILIMKLNLWMERYLIKRAGKEIPPVLKIEMDYYNHL